MRSTLAVRLELTHDLEYWSGWALHLNYQALPNINWRRGKCQKINFRGIFYLKTLQSWAEWYLVKSRRVLLTNIVGLQTQNYVAFSKNFCNFPRSVHQLTVAIYRKITSDLENKQGQTENIQFLHFWFGMLCWIPRCKAFHARLFRP